MIGGTSPVIVFVFPDSGILGSLGLPTILPIYLDENFTKVASDGTQDAVRIDTQVFKNLAYQRKVGQTLSMTLRISKDNVVGSTLVALMSKIYDIINSSSRSGFIDFFSGESSEGYFITIYHDSSFMLKGYLSSFEKTNIENTNMLQIKATFTSIPAKAKLIAIVSKVANAIPLGA